MEKKATTEKKTNRLWGQRKSPITGSNSKWFRKILLANGNTVIYVCVVHIRMDSVGLVHNVLAVNTVGCWGNWETATPTKPTDKQYMNISNHFQMDCQWLWYFSFNIGSGFVDFRFRTFGFLEVWQSNSKNLPNTKNRRKKNEEDERARKNGSSWAQQQKKKNWGLENLSTCIYISYPSEGVMLEICCSAPTVNAHLGPAPLYSHKPTHSHTHKHSGRRNSNEIDEAVRMGSSCYMLHSKCHLFYIFGVCHSTFLNAILHFQTDPFWFRIRIEKLINYFALRQILWFPIPCAGQKV